MSASTPTYFGNTEVNVVRTLLSERNWQDTGKTAWIERAAVLALVIDWAQGRTDAPEAVAEAMSDLHLGSGTSGYGVSKRVNLIMAALVERTGKAALYAPVTAEGLVSLGAWLETLPVREVPLAVGEADTTLEQHPNVRRALKHAGVVTREDVAAVLAHSRFRSNISGGRSSDYISAAAAALTRAGSAAALREQDAEDSAKLSQRASAWR